jgi:hypothetical protein
MSIAATILSKSPESRGQHTAESYSVAITSTPVIAAGAAAGATPTVAISGDDLAGTITITTGTTALGANGILATITFGNTFGAAPDVLITPANQVANELTVDKRVVCLDADTTTALFKLRAGTNAPADGTAYVFNYKVENATVTLTITAKWLFSVEQVQVNFPNEGFSISGNVVTIKGVPCNTTGGQVTLLGKM